MYTEIIAKNQTKAEIMSTCLYWAKTTYQQRLITGEARLSCSELRGSAKNYVAKYKKSQESLFSNLKQSGLNVYERKHGNKRILVIEG